MAQHGLVSTHGHGTETTRLPLSFQSKDTVSHRRMQTKKKKVCHSNEQRMKSAIKPSATAAIPMTHEGNSGWRETGRWPSRVKMHTYKIILMS